MQYFFNNHTGLGSTTVLAPDWQVVKDGLQNNLDMVQRHYYNRPHAVKSHHFLVRLLNNIGVPYSHQLERFHSIVETKALQLSVGFKMTSPISRGSLFNGIFFGEGSAEVLIASDESFNPYLAEKNWRQVQAVKVISHPKSDLGYTLANGKKSGTETGVSFIVINIPLLAVQFRSFMQEQLVRVEKYDINPQTVAQFIHMHVLPNMVASQVNQALFNRAYNIAFSAPMGESLKTHPFMLLNYSDRVDKVYRHLCNYLKGNERDMRTMLASFPCIGGTFESLMRLPELVPTRQYVWAEVLSRIKVIDFLTELSPSRCLSRNASEINEITRMLKFYQNDSILTHALPKELARDYSLAIENILEKVKRK